jgi:hypothetical protein
LTQVARSYYLVKDIILGTNKSDIEKVNHDKIFKQFMYWRAEEELEQTLDRKNIHGIKKDFTKNFSNQLILAKRDKFKLLLLKIIAHPWNLSRNTVK